MDTSQDENEKSPKSSELIIRGFIQSSEAAEKLGCTTDHIARLCRAGDLQCIREGSRWLAFAQSLERYMGRSQKEADELKRKLSETRRAEYEANQYLSSPKAANEIGYTPDHIARLCRAGTLQCIQENGRWRVHRESLRVYRERIKETAEKWQQKLSEERKDAYLNALEKRKPLVQKITARIDTHIVRPLSYVASISLIVSSLVLLGSFFLNQHIEYGSIVASDSDVFYSEQLALVWSRFSSVLDPFSDFLSRTFFPYTPPPVAEIKVKERKPSITTGSTNPTTVVNNITNNNTTNNTFNLTGVSSGELDKQIAELEKRVISLIPRSISYSGPSQTTPVRTQTFAQAQRIDQLSGVAISGGTITGSAISGGSLSGVAISAGSIEGVLAFANGGTGTTTVPAENQLLVGNGAGYDLRTLTAGSNITISTTSTSLVISSSGASSFGQSFEIANGALAPTTTLGILVSASSTIQSLSVTNGTTTNATSTTLAVSNTASTSRLIVSNSFTLSNLSGFLKATAGAVATSLIDLATDVTGILVATLGGTGWGTIQANTLLLGNGTNKLATTTQGTNGQTLALVSGVPSWVATTTSSCGSGINCSFSGGTWTYSNAGVTSVKQTYGSGLTGAITFATSSVSFNGLTLANIITDDGASTFTIAPAISGTLNNAGLTNSSVSYGGVSLALGASDATPAFNLIDATGLPIVGGTTGTLSIARGGSGTTTAPISQLLYGGSSAYQSVATTSATIGTGLTYSGTFGTLVGGIAGTLSTTLGTSVDLASEVTGTLPVVNGGTATTTFYNGGLTFYNSTLGTLSQASAQTGLFYDNANSRLGIGTTTPFAKLTVIGPDTLTSPTLSLRQSNNTAYGFDFDIESASVGRLDLNRVVADTRTQVLSILRGSGNVGVGTTSPFARLAVNPIAGDTNQFVVGSSTATSFIINSAGNVGIGTSSPTTRLNVGDRFLVGSTKFGDSGNFDFTLGGQPSPDFAYITGNNKLYTRSIIINENADTSEIALRRFNGTYASPTSISQNDIIGVFYFQGFINGGFGSSSPSYARSGQIYSRYTDPNATTSGGNLAFAVTKHGETVLRSRAFLNQDGHFALLGRATYEDGSLDDSTYTPPAVLSILTGDDGIENAISIRASVNSTLGFDFAIDNSTGNLIGKTTSSIDWLRVDRITGATTFLNASTTQLGSTGSSYFATSGGNVGIGTTSPFAKLAVNPVAGDTNQFVVGSSTATSLIVTNGGNVGIGTTSPTSALVVAQGSSSSPVNTTAALNVLAYVIAQNDGVHDGIKSVVTPHAGSGGFSIGVEGIAETALGSTWTATGTHGFVGISGIGRGTMPSSRIWGGNFRAISSSSTVSDLSGVEIDLQAETQSQNRYGLSIVANALGAFAGTGEDMMIRLINKIGGAQWADGIVFTGGGASVFPISSTGTLIRTANSAAQTIATGINISSVTITGNAIATPNSFVVKGSGAVGIGTTSPWGLLSVNPNGISGPSFVVGSSTATSLIVTNGGNVGIGITDPETKLEIAAGNILLSNNQALQFEDTGGANRTLVTLTSSDVATFGLANNNATVNGFNIDFTSARATGGGTDEAFLFNTSNNLGTADEVYDFQDGGSSLLTILGNGNVGIGTTSPFAKLAVNPVAGDTNQFVVGSSTATSLIINNAGNLGIGTTSIESQVAVDIYSNIPGGIPFKLTNSSVSGFSGFNFYDENFALAGSVTYSNSSASVFPNDVWIGNRRTSVGSDLVFATNGVTERMRILQNGNIGIGTSSPYLANTILTIEGNDPRFAISDNAGANPRPWSFRVSDGSWIFRDEVVGGDRFKIDTSGFVLPGIDNTQDLGSSSFHWSCLFYDATNLGTCSSDERLKENIRNLDLGENLLEQVANLKPRTFDWIDGAKDNYGLVAQEVMERSPRLVETGDDGYLKVSYGKLQYLIIGAIQELYAMVVENANKLAEFSAKIMTREIYVENHYVSNQLCIGETCISEVELKELLALRGQVANGTDAQDALAEEAGNTTTDTTAPTITVFGNNPAEIAVGDTYVDLGASVSDDTDQNLGIHTFVDGVEVTSVSLDTSTSTTYTITYRATDQAGNVGEATRTVVVGKGAGNSEQGTEEGEPQAEGTQTEELPSKPAPVPASGPESAPQGEEPISNITTTPSGDGETALASEETAITTQSSL